MVNMKQQEEERKGAKRQLSLLVFDGRHSGSIRQRVGLEKTKNLSMIPDDQNDGFIAGGIVFFSLCVSASVCTAQDKD